MNIIFFICVYFLIAFIRPVLTFYDPLSVPNNKYGIHIADVNDLPLVKPLVNSTGGDWGYVTVVIQQSDRNTGKWQDIFNQMRRNHLIPIVRLATYLKTDYWAIPDNDSINDWVVFLNSLNWPIANRYVILYNEPNHSKEWGNTIDPEGYADFFVKFAGALHKTSADFFILPAALDVSAASDNLSLNAAVYLSRMIQVKPEVFVQMDGWNSHSYPNPAFSGTPYDTGRGTLRTYQWELNYLKSLGLSKNLPVFITETGWVHNLGKNVDNRLLNPIQISQYLTEAANTVWTDNDIVAITPFVFNYQDTPFDHFSWKEFMSDEFYPQYDSYKAISKIHGLPKQHQRYKFIPSLIPGILVSASEYSFTSELNNLGQNIFGSDNGYGFQFSATNPQFSFLSESLSVIEPGHHSPVTIHLKSPDEPGKYHTILSLGNDSGQVVVDEKDVQVVPPPSLKLHIVLAWRKSYGLTAKVLIYDMSNRLIHEFKNQRLVNGDIPDLQLRNIVPDSPYRIVVNVPYYLPRQGFTVLSSSRTDLTLPRLYPLDLDQDGKLSLHDFYALMKFSPARFLILLFGI